MSASNTGQLIDLGTEPAPPPPQNDIVSQLAQLGITSDPAPPTQTGPQSTDEFDIFAKSSSAYSHT